MNDHPRLKQEIGACELDLLRHHFSTLLMASSSSTRLTSGAIGAAVPI